MPGCLSFLPVMLKFMKTQQSLNRISNFPMQADQFNFNPFPPIGSSLNMSKIV